MTVVLIALILATSMLHGQSGSLRGTECHTKALADRLEAAYPLTGKAVRVISSSSAIVLDTSGGTVKVVLLRLPPEDWGGNLASPKRKSCDELKQALELTPLDVPMDPHQAQLFLWELVTFDPLAYRKLRSKAGEDVVVLDGTDVRIELDEGRHWNEIDDTEGDDNLLNQNPQLMDWVIRLRKAVREALPTAKR